MSLLERVLENGENFVSPQNRWSRLRSELRAGLVARLGYRELARIADERDADRARGELDVALFAVLNDAAFDSLGDEERARLAREVADDVVGLGPLEVFMTDDSVSEVMVNGTNSLYYERAGELHLAERVFETDEQIRAAIERIIAPLGRRIDEQSPIVNARLKNGFRVNAVIPPVAVDGPLVTIRKFSSRIVSLDEMVRLGSLPEWYAWLLAVAVRTRQNIAVVGGTGSGKTTLLNALSRAIGPNERIVTIEDSAELKFAKEAHVARLEARDASIEGTGAVTIRDLVTNALRMRPDRIVVGEVRGGEAIDMLQAMNTGHDGSLTTLHAGTPYEAVLRLVLMARFGIDLPASVIEGQIATALDCIVMTGRVGGGARRVEGLTLCSRLDDGTVGLRDCVVYDEDADRWEVREEPPFVAQAVARGVVDEGEVGSWRSLLCA
jgi:pilus assembly protein CpaF